MEERLDGKEERLKDVQTSEKRERVERRKRGRKVSNKGANGY